ncbi:hypothetical protein MLD38_035850 [Melastoma candidum]|uniref:Uncharacterized protein n=1 Tax=Melastoma candidum TaxID=119954 RepID=A0ACB9LHR9_9MYRT|nr:hypothetical protein MLD38_035850 [Melastoma candidum]
MQHRTAPMGHHNHHHLHESGFLALPDALVESVVSLTTPLDACRLASVSSAFRSAADSDAVWSRFLPGDYPSIVRRAVDPSFVSRGSVKELYLSLCNGHVLIDDGALSFWLDGRTGAKCYMISARALSIVWADTPRYWKWISVPDSRFQEVAELISVCWLEIRGKIDLGMLSPGTNYAAYLVFKSGGLSFGFENQEVEVAFGVEGGEYKERTVYLDPDRWRRQRQQQVVPRRGFMGRWLRRVERQEGSKPGEDDDGKRPKERKDGWMEVELGEVFIGGGGCEGEVEMRVMEVKCGDWKGGIIVQGIEIRPKDRDANHPPPPPLSRRRTRLLPPAISQSPALFLIRDNRELNDWSKKHVVDIVAASREDGFNLTITYYPDSKDHSEFHGDYD